MRCDMPESAVCDSRPRGKLDVVDVLRMVVQTTIHIVEYERSPIMDADTSLTLSFPTEYHAAF